MRLVNFRKFDSRNSKKLSSLKGMFLALFLVLGIISNYSYGQVSLTFSSGYLGTQNSAVQSTNTIKNFATLGIARVSFGQSYPGLNTFGGTQGNDLAGVIKLYLTSGRIISLNGALNWRETVTGDVVVYGLIIDEGQIATITYGASQTYTINGGSTSGTSTSIGLRSYLSTLAFTDGESRNGNAATSGIIANMNAELLSSPQPSSITLTNSNVIESQNLVYTVTLNTATTAGRPQVYTFNTSGTAIKGADFNETYTLSNGVLDNGDGTITVPGGVSSFSITVATIDDVNVESIENVLLSVGSKTGLGSIVDNDAPTAPNCDVNNPYDKIVSGYHQSIALKTDASFAVWGEDLDNSGAGEVLTPKDINVTNYPNLVGTPLKATIGGNGNTGNEQAVLLTTDGLYVWGSVGYVINYELKGSTGFGKINTNNFTASNVNTATGLPLGVNPYDVKMMTATYATLVLLTNAGDVWILSQNAGALNATGSTGVYPKTWFKAKIDATTFLTGITAIRVQTSTASLNAIIALKSDGTVYTWGSSTYLGDGSASTQRTYATKMTLPGEFSITNIPKMIAVTGGIKNSTSVKNSYYILSNSGALYSLGYNAQKQLGDFTTTERTSWVNAKMNATTNFSNVSFITAQEHDASFPGVAIVTKTGDLYTWGQNEGLALGRNTEAANYDPGMPLGFTSGTDIALSAELGGHTLVYLKQGTTQFCYVGHKTSGSMGDGVSASSFINTFNCTGTPSMNICGSVPVAASNATSTITASPTTILANGSTTSIITVQLKQSNGTNLTSTGGTVVISTNKGTVSDVTDNNNGTYTAILTSSTFVETATLNYTLNGSSGVNSATVNFMAVTNPVITTTGSLKTFTTCLGCTVSPQTFSLSGVDLSTNNIVITAPTGVQVSTNANTDFATSINIVPTAGTVTTTTVYAKLTNNATSAASGVISVTSTGATSKTITVTTNTDNALNFDGTNDYVVLPSSLGSAYNNSAFTIEAWIKTTESSSTSRKDIIAWGSTTALNNVVEFRVGRGKLEFVLNDGSVFYQLTSTSNINTGKWVHVAVVKSGTTVNLYINGQVASTTVAGNVNSSPSLNAANIGVLQYKDGSSYTLMGDSYFNGGIDQLRVWNTVKTSSDILANMFVEMAGNETGLVANYDFNQGIANGSNSITTLNDNSTNAYNGTLNSFASTGTTSNFVLGFIPEITAAGNSTILSSGNTLQLSNGLSGGFWSSSNTSFATVNSSTGLVTGVAAGSATITYTICEKTVSYALTIVTPTITIGSLKQFTSCSGCTITPQSFTVAGTNLFSNLTVTAPTGFVMSTTATGTYVTSLTYTPTSGTLATTSVFVKLTNSATTASSGNFTVASTGAASKTVTATVNTDNALHFDGIDDLVFLDNTGAVSSLAFTGTANFTLEAWVKREDVAGLQMLISKYKSGVGANYYIGLDNGKPYLNREASPYRVTADNVLPVNEWHHIAGVYDGSNMKLYIDGVLVKTEVNHTGSLLGSVSSVPVAIGGGFASDGSVVYKYKGAVDEVRIWNTARTSDQIRLNYLTELAGNETGLVAYYDFNTGIINGINSINDIISNKTNVANINGTLQNFFMSGTLSNFVSGIIPLTTAADNATTVPRGNTLQLSNVLTGGVWASSNTAFATVNSTTGLVTGVAVGSLNITYTVCNKTVAYNLTVVVPTLTTSTLNTFTSCSGCSITPQSFTVTGTYLGANVIVTAPTGFEVANTSGGTYSSTITLTASSGTLTSTYVFARLINNATTATSANFTVASTGAASKTVTATVNTDNALNFDGVNDHVVLDNIGSNTNFAFAATANFTLEAWVNRKANTATSAILSKYDGGVAGNYWLSINSSGTVAFSREASPWSINSTNTMPVNEWHHIAGVFDGSTMKLYIDGVLDNSVAATGSIGSSVSAIKVYIGAANQNSALNFFFKGGLDEIRVWNVARTASEIQNAYAVELQGNESGLAAYYNFNQGMAGGSNTIATLIGKTATPYNGTLNGFGSTLSGTASNFVAGAIPEITGESILNKGLTTTYTNGLTGGTWSSAATNIATVNATTGAVTGVNPGTSTITYTICEKTISKLLTIVVPTITTSGTLTIFNTCLGTASAAQTFTVSAQYLTANLVLTAPAGYELATSSGGTYSSTLSIAPSSGTVSARLIYVRLSTSSVNGQSGNIAITSTDAVTQNISTGAASVTRTVVASVTISSNATNNTICSGTSITFTASATNGGLLPTYQWYNASGAISGAISATYSTTSLVNNDVISVQMGSSLTSCVTGSPATSNSITTTVTTIPSTPGVISGLTTICLNSNQVYSVAAVSGATSYTWVVTGNISATISSTTNVLNITASNAPGSGTLEVFANNACGTSIGSASYSITVNNTPAPTAGFTVSGNTVCLTSAGVTFTSTSTPNATTSSTITTYAWTFGDGTTAATSTASNTYTGSGSFDAILTITDAAACTSSISTRITVDPISVAGTATAVNTIICEGSNTTLNLTGNTGTIQWQSSTDGSSFTNITGATSVSYNTGSLTTTTYYQAVVTSGVCSAATSGVVTVTVSPTPSITISQVANVYATATSFDVIYNNPIGAPDAYSISTIAPNAMSGFTLINNYGLLGSPINVSIPASAVGTYNFNLTVANGALGCTSTSIPFTLTVAVLPPASLSYTSPNVYTSGTTITSLNPTSTGGPIATFSIAPSLPAGVTLNTSTGIISGTPTATSVQTSYTVTGTNASGTITATVVITVIVAAPVSLLYTTPNVYTVGTTITTINPTSIGGTIATYSIGPSLPAGLTLNTSTGIISGTPTATSVQTSYTVTGTNAAGTVTATVVITVNEAAPISLSYTTPNVYTVGTTITSLNPTSTGGPIATYSIAPSLPVGLTLNTSTGIISGTPTATSVQTSYTVTGTNAAGTVTATVVITVNEAAPLSLSYTTPNVDTVGVVSQTLNPTSTGGPIVSYSITPSLPAGLTLNTSTGIITGTPTATSVQTSYIVTGTNASGTVTATVVITVNDAAPISLLYNTPNVYTVGTTITSLNPTSTGGPIASYSIAPSLPLGLILNTSTGIISGTPTATSAQTSYTVTGTNTSGTVTANVIITVVSGQPLLPQGGINAVDYKLLASDTVKIKLNIQAGASPFNIIIGNNKNNLKDTIANAVNGDIIKLSPINNTTIYSIVKLTDNNGIARTSAFSKDTTLVTILAPNIALTLKADKAIKQTDNSFNTKLLLKIKNSGEIDLKNVQVNANLSEVFPVGINYTLDSVRVLTGNVILNSGYKGNGTAKSPNSVNKGVSTSSGVKVNAILDANYLFSNGVNMAINEESEISFYISIAPTAENVVLKLQFTSAGEGVLAKSDGSTSQQSSIAASDDGTNIALHPNNTNLGIPAPTYLPLVPIASIGATLSASGPTIVTDGYTFDFVAKLKNFSNINLDTISIINDFSKTFTSPDTAYIINTPVVTGGITYNTNFNGYSNTLLIDSAVKLVVGDSVTIAYTLFVKTNKTIGSWSNSILGSGHSTIDYVYVSDVSTDGINPDPNGDNDPIEQGSTSFYVNYTPPAPPVVENKTYILGTTMPLTIAPLVKSYPTGSIPVWCNVATILCSTIAPATPTLIGKYMYQLRSYDTTTKLYSIDYVNDTVIIKPPVPLVKDSTYIIGLNTNPANIGVQVSGMQGSVLNYFLLVNRQSAVPVLSTTASVKRYTVSQTVNEIESDTVGFNVTMLNQNDMVHLQKLAEEPILQSNSTFNITYKFIVNNLSAQELTNVLITDNLQNTIPITAEYTIVSISATGGLVANSSFNGSTNTYLTNASSKVNAFAKDTVVFTLNIKPKGFSGVMNNTATIAATSRYGAISMVSSAATKISETSKSPTPVIIPDVIIDIPEVFSPNRDGVNDRFVIIKPFGTTLNLEIFNRWGNIVYANPNYNNEWDGRGTNNFIGQDLLDGGYYYNLKAINKNGGTKIFKGFVIIQR